MSLRYFFSAVLDSVLYEAAFNALKIAAFFFYCLKQFEGFLRDGLRQFLYVVGAASGIGDRVEVGFVSCKKLNVSRHSP